MPAPLVLIDAVGLTPRWLAHAPRLRALAEAGWSRPLREVLPAVTCTAQATPAHRPDRRAARHRRQRLAVPRHRRGPLLAAVQPPASRPSRSTSPPDGERRSAAAPSAAPSSSGGSTRGRPSMSASRPNPTTAPTATRCSASPARRAGLTERLEAQLGPFPFPTFWGPMAGLPCTQWIARCAAEVLRERAARPDARLPAAPRLRPAALRPRRLRHAAPGRRTGRRLRTAAGRGPRQRRPGLGGQRIRPRRRSSGRRCLNRALRRAGSAERASRAVRRDARHLRQPGLRRVRSPAGPRLRPRCGRCAARARRAGRTAGSGASAGRRGTRGAGSAPPAIRRTRGADASRTPGSPIPSGSTTAGARTTPAPWTSIASRATTRANCSSIRNCGGRRAGPPGGCSRRSSASARCSTWCRWTRPW